MKIIKRRVNESIQISSKNTSGILTLLESHSIWSRVSLQSGSETISFWQRSGQNFAITSTCGQVNIKLTNTRARATVNFNISAPASINITKQEENV